MNDKMIEGPAKELAVPTRAKIPAPIIAPIPKNVKSKTFKTLFNLELSISDNASFKDFFLNRNFIVLKF
jgi:hypothetical protein